MYCTMYNHHNFMAIVNNDTALNKIEHKHTLTALIGLAILTDPSWESEHHELTG